MPKSTYKIYSTAEPVDLPLFDRAAERRGRMARGRARAILIYAAPID